MSCNICGDTGRTKENKYECQACGKKWINSDLVDTNKKINNFNINKKYSDINFDANSIYIKYKDTKEVNQNLFKTYMETLKVLSEKTKEGLYLNRTIFVQMLGEETTNWAYYTIKCIKETNLQTTLNIINVADLDSKEKMEEIMDIDVLFLQVSNFNLEESINNLCYLMDKREQMDKTTIVLSRMNYKYLRDKSNQAFYIETILDY